MFPYWFSQTGCTKGSKPPSQKLNLSVLPPKPILSPDIPPHNNNHLLSACHVADTILSNLCEMTCLILTVVP